MAKVRIKFRIMPGGAVQGLGVTDLKGKAINPAKCRRAMLEVGGMFGPVDAKSVKALPPKVTVNQDEDVKLG